MRQAVRAFVVGGLALIGVLLAAASAEAATRVVDDDKVQCPTAPFDSIQDAVDAAAPGDTVLVCNGVYGPVMITKNNLRLIAKVVHGASIQAPTNPGLPGIVWVRAGVSGVEVSRFVIEKGPHSGQIADGIFLESGGASLRTARHNLIRRVDATGIFVQDGAKAHDIAYNRIEEYGGSGIFVGGFVGGTGAFATMSFNTLVGQPSSFAGIVIGEDAKASAVGNRIVDNPGLAGIAVLSPAPSGVSLSGNQVFDNARGILLDNVEGASVRQNRVSQNLQEGIRAEESSSGNVFWQNDARGNGGTDCFDASTNSPDSGPAGYPFFTTANKWGGNKGFEAIPAGICTP